MVGATFTKLKDRKKMKWLHGRLIDYEVSLSVKQFLWIILFMQSKAGVYGLTKCDDLMVFPHLCHCNFNIFEC